MYGLGVVFHGVMEGMSLKVFVNKEIKVEYSSKFWSIFKHKDGIIFDSY